MAQKSALQAPHLFIIVVEALTATVKMWWGSLLLEASPSLNALPNKSLGQYVDNTSFTVRAEDASDNNLMGILWKSGLASGLEIN